MDTGAIIAIIATVLIIGGAVAYIIKAKKSGAKCVGCPYSKECASKKNCTCDKSNEENK